MPDELRGLLSILLANGRPAPTAGESVRGFVDKARAAKLIGHRRSIGRARRSLPQGALHHLDGVAGFPVTFALRSRSKNRVSVRRSMPSMIAACDLFPPACSMTR